MSFGVDPLSELVLPDETVVEERDLVTTGDVLVGGQSNVSFGIRGRNVVAGERVQFGGHIEAEGDCRLDMWCAVTDNVLVGRDAYLGERVRIDGRLMVSGDLDIGDDVQIQDGFEANGWIVIRNPMPTIVFLFIYLTQLLRLGEEEEAAAVLEDVLDDDRAEDPLTIPRGGHVSDDAWRVSTPARIGNDCRLHGNIRAASITLGTNNTVFGSLRARGDIDVGRETTIHGDVTTRGGDVTLVEGSHVLGDVSCENLAIYEDVTVDGSIRSRGEVTMVRPESEQAEE